VAEAEEARCENIAFVGGQGEAGAVYTPLLIVSREYTIQHESRWLEGERLGILINRSKVRSLSSHGLIFFSARNGGGQNGRLLLPS
jgi:hypothetical protein